MSHTTRKSAAHRKAGAPIVRVLFGVWMAVLYGQVADHSDVSPDSNPSEKM